MYTGFDPFNDRWDDEVALREFARALAIHSEEARKRPHPQA